MHAEDVAMVPRGRIAGSLPARGGSYPRQGLLTAEGHDLREVDPPGA